jgi:signal recognition particle subunit SEC65
MSNESKFDVFLCHNSEDKPKVKAVAGALKEVGVKCWLDEAELTPGKLWEPAIIEEILRTESAAIFIGERGFGPYQEKEVQKFLQQALKNCRIIPVLLPNASNPGKLPDFLTVNNLWKGLSERTYIILDQPGKINQLIWGILDEQPDSIKAKFAQLHYERGMKTLEDVLKVKQMVKKLTQCKLRI